MVSSDFAPASNVTLVEVVVVVSVRGEIGGLHSVGEDERALGPQDGNVIGETRGASAVTGVLNEKKKHLCIYTSTSLRYSAYR